MNKSIYGAGFLVSGAVAANLEANLAATKTGATHEWKLSEREQRLIESLGT